MSELQIELANLELDGLELDELELVSSEETLESMTVGHGMVEIGASAGLDLCCSCCLVCCCCCA